MRDPLKDLIDAHRPELDTVDPSAELWTKIETAMYALPVIPAKSFPWLKYLSMVAAPVAIIAVAALLKNGKVTTTTADHETTAVHASAPVVAPNAPTPPNDQRNAILPVATSTQSNADDTPAKITSPEQPFTVTEIPAASNGLPESNTFLSGTNFSRQLRGETLSFDSVFSGITRLEVTCASADVIVQAHAGDELRMKSTLSWKGKGIHVQEHHYTLNCERKDTVLYIMVTLDCDGDNKTMVGSSITSGNLSFEVPEKLNLVIRSQFGDASVTGIRGSVCNVIVSSGDIALNNIGSSVKTSNTFGNLVAKNITGNVVASVSSGDATIEKLTGDLALSTTFGDQKLSEITGTVKTSASSGSIDVNGMVGDARISTTFGDIKLKNYKGKPTLSASSGSIRGNDIELTGNTSLVTTFGDISLQLKNPMDALSFELVTTFGDIVIDKDGQHIEEESHYRSKKGDILIKASSSSGSQEFH